MGGFNLQKHVDQPFTPSLRRKRRYGKPSQLQTHTQTNTQCTFKHKHNHVRPYKHANVCVRGVVDEGTSLRLGSHRAVMYKACVDIV